MSGFIICTHKIRITTMIKLIWMKWMGYVEGMGGDDKYI
jgi:hypothetical protein